MSDWPDDVVAALTLLKERGVTTDEYGEATTGRCSRCEGSGESSRHCGCCLETCRRCEGTGKVRSVFDERQREGQS